MAAKHRLQIWTIGVFLLLSLVIGCLILNRVVRSRFQDGNRVQKIIRHSRRDASIPITYHPQTQDLIQLVFEYPGWWTWHSWFEPAFPYWDGYIVTSDPTKPIWQIGILGTQEPNFERGAIRIFVLQIDPASFSADTFVGDYLRPVLQKPWSELLIDEATEVDGYPARRVVRRIAPRIAPMNQVPLLAESIFVQVGDKYYEFSLEIPESERSWQYGQAFDRLIESVHFIP